MSAISLTFNGNPTLFESSTITRVRENGTGAIVTTVDGANTIVTESVATINGLLASADTQVAVISLTNAQVLALGTTAQTLVAAPGAGKFIDVQSVVYASTGQSAAGAGGGNLTVKVGGGAVYTTAVATALPAAAANIKAVNGGGSQVANSAVTLDASAAVTTFTGGTLKVFVTYKVCSL